MLVFGVKEYAFLKELGPIYKWAHNRHPRFDQRDYHCNSLMVIIGELLAMDLGNPGMLSFDN